MAKTKRKTANKRRKKKKVNVKALVLLIIAVIIALAIIAAIAAVITFLGKRKAPAQELTDLKYYYNLSANSADGRQMAGDDELAIVFEDEILTERAFKKDSEVYIRLGLVTDNIDNRFYYDSNEQVLILTDAEMTRTVYMDQTGYTAGTEQVNTDYVVLTERNGTAYVAVDFVSEYSSAYYGVYDDPARIVITYEIGEKTFCDVKKNTEVRVLGGVKAEIVGMVEKGEKLLVLDDLDDWLEVVSTEGWKGYVAASAVSEQYKETVESDYTGPEYVSKNLGKAVKLGWASIDNLDGNDEYGNFTEDSDGILNVYCPTWFSLADTGGGLDDLSDRDYVDRAHSDGYLVWAMFADTSAEFAEQVLTHTSTRQRVEDDVIGRIISNGMDGLNIDFEHINSSYGNAYLQFLRELSIKCRQNDLYFSVDNYAPYEYNACYHIEEQGTLCDYVFLMAYDDYVGSGDVGPNSSLTFVREVLELTLSKVSASEKVVVGLPFYSRVWARTDEGTLTRKEYTMDNAWDLMREVDEDPEWDSESGTWTTEYTISDTTYYAWLEDEATIREKLNLVKEYDVGGVAFWCLGQEFTSVWDEVAGY